MRRLESQKVPNALYPSLRSLENNLDVSRSSTPRRESVLKSRRELFPRRLSPLDSNEVIPKLYSVPQAPVQGTYFTSSVASDRSASRNSQLPAVTPRVSPVGAREISNHQENVFSDDSSASEAGSAIDVTNVPKPRLSWFIARFLHWGDTDKETSEERDREDSENSHKEATSNLSEHSTKESNKQVSENLRSSEKSNASKNSSKKHSRNLSEELIRSSSKKSSTHSSREASRESSKLYQTATESNNKSPSNNKSSSNISDTTTTSDAHIVARQHSGITPSWAFRPRNPETGAAFGYILPRTSHLCPSPRRCNNRASQTEKVARMSYTSSLPSVEMPKYSMPLSKVALKLFIPRFSRWAQARGVHGQAAKLYLPLAIMSPTAQQYFIIHEISKPILQSRGASSCMTLCKIVPWILMTLKLC